MGRSLRNSMQHGSVWRIMMPDSNSYVVEYLDASEAPIGPEEIFIRSNILTLLDSVRTKIMHDDELLEDCCGLNIRLVDDSD